jgi:hypothetical protein
MRSLPDTENRIRVGVHVAFDATEGPIYDLTLCFSEKSVSVDGVKKRWLRG